MAAGQPARKVAGVARAMKVLLGIACVAAVALVAAWNEMLPEVWIVRLDDVWSDR